MPNQLAKAYIDDLVKPETKIPFYLDFHKTFGVDKGFKPDRHFCGDKERWSWNSDDLIYNIDGYPINLKMGLVFATPLRRNLKGVGKYSQSGVYIYVTAKRPSERSIPKFLTPTGHGFYYFGSGLVGMMSNFINEGVKVGYYQSFNGKLCMSFEDGDVVDKGNGKIELGSSSREPDIIISPNSVGQVTPRGKKHLEDLAILCENTELSQDTNGISDKKILDKEKRAFEEFMELYKKFLATAQKIPVAETNEI